MQTRLKYLRGKTFWFPKSAYMTREGRPAYDEAIEFLENQKPLPALAGLSVGLCLAAADLASDLGMKSLLGHKGSDDTTVDLRCGRYGKWSGGLWEDICYGIKNAEDIVSELIVDDGIPTRFHRKNVYREGITLVGVGMADHVVHGTVCVIVYAKGFEDFPVSEQHQMHDWVASMQQRTTPCPGCRRDVKAMSGIYVCGRNWHIECCECVDCRQAITQFFPHDGKPYCSDCHKKSFAEVCTGCETPLPANRCKINGIPLCTGCYDREWDSVEKQLASEVRPGSASGRAKTPPQQQKKITVGSPTPPELPQL
eukprot:TRINITY_DN77787_c0_g1_i1.p1 TRINITY_DN77787_c0_g1~~TRINITY_DN77787_c0_g1_i1.p1  ORF type:complete len:364 (-),score=17.23 TRINITY_DN77787_c0_g1_i1:34-966(-)